jgi:hypothetical protein
MATALKIGGLIVVAGLFLPAPAALADDSAAPDKNMYSPLNPTPPDAMRAFDPERPAKILNPFTVDAGHFQIESDLFDYVHSNFAGFGTQVFETADPTIKLGLTSSIDFELALNGDTQQSDRRARRQRPWLRRHDRQAQDEFGRR